MGITSFGWGSKGSWKFSSSENSMRNDVAVKKGKPTGKIKSVLQKRHFIDTNNNNK